MKRRLLISMLLAFVAVSFIFLPTAQAGTVEYSDYIVVYGTYSLMTNIAGEGEAPGAYKVRVEWEFDDADVPDGYTYYRVYIYWWQTSPHSEDFKVYVDYDLGTDPDRWFNEDDPDGYYFFPAGSAYDGGDVNVYYYDQTDYLDFGQDIWEINPLKLQYWN